MHRLALAALLAVSSLAVSGCVFTGVGCDSFEAFSASELGAPCFLFSGDCCAEQDANGFSQCGSLTEGFTFSCGEGAHGDGCFCFQDDGAKSTRQRSVLPTYVVPPFTYDVALPFAGMRSAHRLSFDVVLDGLQTFSGAVTYAAGFGFGGFTALGPAGTQIGSYGGDFSADGVADITLPVRAATADLAYVDIDLNGQATAVDPTIQHVADVPSPGAHTFILSLPAGGDMAPNLARAFRAFRAIVTLAPGIVDNPPNPGAYGITGTFTSIDPDTGGASNGAGQTPLTANTPPTAIAIDPSPLELVDHFLCYKTKLSKGSRCGPTSFGGEGFVCTSDAECGGVAGACIKNKLAKGLQASLADRYGAFMPRTVDVTKPTSFCAPADKNGEGVNDDRVHLRGFAVKEAKGETKRVTSAPLQIVNQLGTLAVTIKAPAGVLEPTPKAVGGPPTMPFVDAVVDRYQCYKAKVLTKRCAADPSRACKNDAACGGDGPCLGKFPKGLQVSLTDSFASGKIFDVVKPTRLCTPALANGAPIYSEEGQLLCYKVKPAAGQSKHTPTVGIHTLTPIGRDRLETIVEDELCVPSLELTTPR